MSFSLFSYTYYKLIRIFKVKTEVKSLHSSSPFSTDRLRTNEAESSMIANWQPLEMSLLWCIQLHL